MKRPTENAVAKGKRFKSVAITEVSQDIGIILSVSLQNFMCHDNLTFDFDPHINFIIGQNGSGKSAILTGIVLALGGKSSDTGRYSNIKGFVKTGKNKARISVTLKNCGPLAYKPEIYGDRIIVERELSVEGKNSSYKLKSADGKIVSHLWEDLKNILIAMDIQIDNPVLVLTQETSRSFLMAKTGREEKLFQFFYKGTGLQKLEDDYKNCLTLNDNSKMDLVAKKQALEVMEKEVKRLEKLRKSDEKLDDLKRESFWARVISMEKELEAKMLEKGKLLKVIEKTKAEAVKSKNKYDKISLNLEEHLKEKADIDKKIDTERKSLAEFGHQSDTCTDSIRTQTGIVNRYKREEKKLIEDIRVIEETIAEHQTKGQTDYENEKRKRNEQISALEEKISDAETEQAEYQRKHEYLLQEHNSKQQELNTLKAEINDFQYKKSIRIREKSQLMESKKNRQVLFGEHTTRVLRDIQMNQHKFIKPPKGPIGLDIKVKDRKWNSAIEACIKPQMLKSFCVDNAQDSVLMTQILQKYYTDRMPSVIVSPFLSHVHDVSNHRAQTNIPTVLDMLIIPDPVITNCLIDQLSIENKILIEDITTAQKIMLDRPPDKCYSAFLLNCDEILLNPYRHYSASGKPSNILSPIVDESYLEKIQQEVNILDTEIAIKESTMKDIRLQLQNYPGSLKKLEEKIVNLTTLQSDALGVIEELKQFDEPINVPEMYDEFLSLKADLEKKQEELSEAEEKLAQLKFKSEEVNGNLNKQREFVKSLKHTFEKLGSDINQCGRNKEVLASSKQQFEAELKKHEKYLGQLEGSIEEANKGIKKIIADREKIDKKPRVVPKQSYEEIDMQIEEMQKVISEQSNSTNKTTLLEKFTEKKKRLYEAKYEYKVIEKNSEEIAKMLKKRAERSNKIFKYTKLIVGYSFRVLLHGNGFVGDINFKPKALQLEATRCKLDAESNKKKACSSLSGGERSFVTISFLIALWERIHMPFRILDEYDVFMDSSNRDLSINLLIQRANQMSDVQFIFLSPLDLPKLRNSSVNIKVHKMPPPQRIGLSNMD